MEQTLSTLVHLHFPLPLQEVVENQRVESCSQGHSDHQIASDATENLLSAVYWAANGPEVTGEGDAAVTVMHAGSGDSICAVSPGVGVRKMHSTRRNAFSNGQR